MLLLSYMNDPYLGDIIVPYVFLYFPARFLCMISHAYREKLGA